MPVAHQMVTPCIYAFSQEIPIRVAREKKLILRAIIHKEENVYRRVFAAFLWSVNEQANKAIARDNFLERMWNDEQIDGTDEDAVKTLCRPVFDHYWEFARQPEFRVDGNQIMAYPVFFPKWQDRMAKELEQQEYHLQRLQEVLEQ
jgi:hypothetical protein